MISRLLLAIVLAATVGLSACEKTEETAVEQQAPATGAAEETKSATEQAAEQGAETAKEGGEKASE